MSISIGALQARDTASRVKGRRSNTETAIVAAVKLEAEALGIRTWRQNPIATPVVHGGEIQFRRNTSGVSGMSDLGGVCPGGRFIAIEVKTATGTLRPRQALYLDDVTRIGGIACVVRAAGELSLLMRPPGSTAFIPFAIRSPFRLTAEERSKAEADALREDARKKLTRPRAR